VGPRPVSTGAKNLAPTGIRSPDRPPRSESLHRLRCPALSCAVRAESVSITQASFYRKTAIRMVSFVQCLVSTKCISLPFLVLNVSHSGPNCELRYALQESRSKLLSTTPPCLLPFCHLVSSLYYCQLNKTRKPLLLPAAIVAGSSNGVTNTRCRRYSRLHS
jgi:hypothetical protein